MLKNKRWNQIKRDRMKVKGALTVEAALVIPVFLFSVISLIRLIFLVTFAMRVQMYADKTLEEYYFLKQAGQDVQPVTENELGTEVAIRGMMLMHLGEGSVAEQHLFFSLFGLDVSFEETEDPNLCVMDVDYSPAILRLPGYTWRKKCSSRVAASKWEGRPYASKPAEDTDYCYVTPHGTVCHLSAECPYLDLSLSQVSSHSIGEYRNADQKRYVKCKECGRSDSVCYITDYGEVWHSSPGCPALRRTILRVPCSECEGKKVCQKCEELKEKGK